MKTKAKILTLLFAAASLSGCAWGPCGPVFTRSSDPKGDERLAEAQKKAEAMKAAMPKSQSPTR